MRSGERGYAFVAVLALLAVAGLSLAAAGESWAQAARRSKELELLRVGAMYAKALKEYRESAPGSLKEYPLRLDQLALDDRFIGVMRHLRKLYPDPVNPGKPWGLVTDDRQRIIGVYSLSAEQPISEAPRSAPGLARNAAHYSDWKFMAEDVK